MQQMFTQHPCIPDKGALDGSPVIQILHPEERPDEHAGQEKDDGAVDERPPIWVHTLLRPRQESAIHARHPAALPQLAIRAMRISQPPSYVNCTVQAPSQPGSTTINPKPSTDSGRSFPSTIACHPGWWVTCTEISWPGCNVACISAACRDVQRKCAGGAMRSAST